jgi:quinol monooxygenase YgiN
MGSETKDPSISEQIVQMVTYDIVGGYLAFSQSLAALVARTQAENLGILRYSFYVNANRTTAESLIVYRDEAAWLKRHETVSSIEEYRRFNSIVRATRIRLFGPLTRTLVEWLSDRGVAYEHCRFECGYAELEEGHPTLPPSARTCGGQWQP